MRLGCNPCDPSPAPYLNRMEEYLQDLKYLANNFKNATGFEKVKTLLKSGATPAATTRKLEPEAFVICVLRSENIAGANMLEAPKTIYQGCEPDVVLTDGTLCEFKSWKNNPTNEEEDEEDIENKYNMGQSMFWNFKNGHTGYNQFKAYLSQSAVSNLNKLRYYFDERKITAVDKVGFVKTIFKDMLYNATANNNQGGLTTKDEEVFQVIWGNTALRGNVSVNYEF